MDAVLVRSYLSEAELVSSIFGAGSEAEYNRRLNQARAANEQPQLVEVVAWGKTRRYAAVKTRHFTDMVKVVEVESQTLVPGNYDDTSFYPMEKGLTKLRELDG